MLILLMSGIASAQTAQTAQRTPAAQSPVVQAEESPAPATAVGSTIFVDPVTGRLTANPAPGQIERLLELGRLRALEAQSTSGGPGTREPTPARIFRTPVGVGAAVGDEFLHALRLQPLADGSFTLGCDIASHQHSLEGPEPVGTPPEESSETPNAKAPEVMEQ